MGFSNETPLISECHNFSKYDKHCIEKYGILGSEIGSTFQLMTNWPNFREIQGLCISLIFLFGPKINRFEMFPN